jgi:hypothetical protein
VSLVEIPLAWVQPWLSKDLRLNGSLGGAAVVSARDGGFAARVADFTVRDGRAVNAGQTVWQGGVSAPAAALTYSPQGWQAEIPALTLAAGGAGQTLTGIRVAQAAGTGQPLSFELKAGAMDLAVLRQLAPALAPQLPAGGTARFSAAGSLGEKKQVALKLALAGVTAGPQRQALPDATLDLRADITADGRITASAPVTLTRGAQKSDLTLGGTFAPTKEGWNFDAQAAGDTVFVDDLKALAALAPEGGAPKAGPPWAGLAGTVRFSVKRVVFSPDYASSLAGTLTVAADGVTLDTRGALGGASSSPFTLKAGVTHTPGGAEPYGLTAEAALADFDVGAWQHTFEMKGTFSARLTSRAVALDALAERVQGKIQLTSRGGVTRLLAVSDEKSGVVQTVAGAGIAFVGSTAAGLIGRGGPVGGVTKVIAQISDLLQEIRFDQLNVTVARNATRDLILEDFTLIAPEVRLTGRGRVLHTEGKELLDQPLGLQLQVAARGALGDMLRSVSLVADKPDGLGYLPLTVELPELGGTLRAPDRHAFYGTLTEHAALKAADVITEGVKRGAGGLLQGAGNLLFGN